MYETEIASSDCQSFNQVLSISMDLFIARTMTTKASLVFQGTLDITESQVSFMRLFSIILYAEVINCHLLVCD